MTTNAGIINGLEARNVYNRGPLNGLPSLNRTSNLGIYDGLLRSPLCLNPSLWLDASDAATVISVSGAVSQWKDKSGNGLNFSQETSANQPVTGTRTQNALNVIDFNRSSSQWLTGGDIMDLGLGAFSIFGVVKFDDTSGASPWGKNVASGAADGRYGLYRDGGRLYGMYDSDTTASGGVDVADSALTARVIGQVLTRNSKSSTHELRVSGTSTIKNFTDTEKSWNLPDPWRIGRYSDNSQFYFYFDGFIAELIVVLRSVSPAEVIFIESYLTAKWGL